jgi:outer membrane protein
VGGGGLLAPDYEGSDDYEFRALPYVRVQYADWLSFSVPEGLKLTLVSDGAFRAGVLAGYRFDREAGDNIALAGWGDVDGSAELGGFAEYRLDAIRLAVDVRQGLSDDTGLQATISARYETRMGPARISVGPQATWADDDATQTYFGITPTQAAASVLGYAPYAADGGFKSYGVGLSAVVPIGDNWSITAIASVSQLAGDAADSPIVAVEGSDTQYMAGLFAGYRF